MSLTARIRSLLLSAALVTSLATATGCVRGGGHAALGALQVAATAVEIIAIASILAHHDAHVHGHRCGHRHRYYDGRYNYWYNGHWEYYDGEAGVWYAY